MTTQPTSAERAEQVVLNFDGADLILKSALPAHLKLLAFGLLRHMPNCRPGLATLAKYCSTSRRTVIRHLKELRDAGFIAIQKSNAREGNTYRFTGATAMSPVTGVSLVPTQASGSDTGCTEVVTPVARTSDTALAPEETRKKILKGDLKRERARGRKAPRDFEPTEAHRVRCLELELNLDDVLRRFKLQEFGREYSDWDDRFSLWCEDQLKRDVQRSSQEPARRYGSAQPNAGKTGWEGLA